MLFISRDCSRHRRSSVAGSSVARLRQIRGCSHQACKCLRHVINKSEFHATVCSDWRRANGRSLPVGTVPTFMPAGNGHRGKECTVWTSRSSSSTAFTAAAAATRVVGRGELPIPSWSVHRESLRRHGLFGRRHVVHRQPVLRSPAVCHSTA